MKPGTPPLKSARLLDQVQEPVRYLHYSLKTEKACLYGMRFFIRWIAAQGAGMRHPRDMGVTDTRCATHLPRTCCRRALTSARYKNYLVTRMSAPP